MTSKDKHIPITRCLIIRHGETDWNLERRYQGHKDIPLNETGRAQAMRAGVRLAQEPIECFLSSDLARAYETAQLIAQRNHRAPTILKSQALREMDMGLAAGLLHDEIIERFGEEFVRLWRLPVNSVEALEFSFPQGETKAQLIERSRTALEAFIQGADYELVALTTHGGVIKHLMHALFPDEDTGRVHNCAAFEISYEHEVKRWRYHGLLEP